MNPAFIPFLFSFSLYVLYLLTSDRYSLPSTQTCFRDIIQKNHSSYMYLVTIMLFYVSLVSFQGFPTFLLENEARVRDVEFISGMQLLSEIPSDVRTTLRTRLPISGV